MSASFTDSQLLCACGVAYNIGANPPVPITQEPYYTNSGFQDQPAQVLATTFPETAACLVGQAAGGGIIIAFRGTEFDSPSDWAGDLLVEPFTPPAFPGGAAFPGTVHAGFYYCTMELIPQVQACLASLKLSSATPVAITGHSKGGAMASLAAYILCQLGTIDPAQLTVTTFASPFPGNADFASAYQQIITQTNYINYLDLVPFLPPSSNTASIIAAATSYAIVKDMMTDFQNWDYAACSSIIQYIQYNSSNAPYITQYSSDHFYLLDGPHDLHEIVDLITAKDPQYLPVLEAHSHACGGGYFTAVCPGISCS